jgi:cytochrome P450 family 142 subfamily A polypeptide 1
MLGFDPSVFDDLLRWSDDIVRGQTSTPTPEVEAARARAMADFRTLQLEVIADRRSRGPQNDLISILCHAEVDGERLDDDSIVLETLLILVGGDETTRHVITMGQLALFDHPEQSSVMRSDSNSLRSGVEEMLRWVSPVKNMARTVVGEVSLHGEILRDGDQVLLMYPSANRDADEFPQPDRFDVRRDPNHHLAFGFGPHYCLGQALARLELAVMFDVLFRRLPDLEPTNDEPLPFRASNFIVGPEAMPVRFTPSARTRP